MKQITEIDDARLVRGLAHPLRIHILRILETRVASPSEIAEEVGAPLGNVSYHVRFLARVGLIELAGTEPRRGAVEHYYRAAGRVQVSDAAWAQVPRIVKDSLVRSTLDQIGRRVVDAAPRGGFDHDDSHLSRRAMTLDPQGFAELAAEIARFLERANEIERVSAVRLGSDGLAPVTAELVAMLFVRSVEDGAKPAESAPPKRHRTRSATSTGTTSASSAKRPRRRVTKS